MSDNLGAGLPERLVDAATTALVADTSFRATMEDLPGWTGTGLYGDAKAAVVAVLRTLAEVAPGTPEYAVEFDFTGLADAAGGVETPV